VIRSRLKVALLLAAVAGHAGCRGGETQPAAAPSPTGPRAENAPPSAPTPPQGVQTPSSSAPTPPQGVQTPSSSAPTPPQGVQTPSSSAPTPSQGAQTPPAGARAPSQGVQTPPAVPRAPSQAVQAPPADAETRLRGVQAPPPGARTPSAGVAATARDAGAPPAARAAAASAPEERAPAPAPPLAARGKAAAGAQPPAGKTASAQPPAGKAAAARGGPDARVAAEEGPPAAASKTSGVTRAPATPPDDPPAGPAEAATPQAVPAAARGKGAPDAGVAALVDRSEEAAAPAASDLMGVPRHARKRASASDEPKGLPIPGGPLPIPGAQVAFNSERVERFMAEGGAALDGRLVDADGGKPVAGAQIEAWMGTKSIHAESDERGLFSFQGLVPGSRLTLWITAAPAFVQERTEVAVPASRPKFEATFGLLPRAAVAGTQEGGVGMFLARRGNRTVITGLVAFGPGERVGLRVGDAIVAIGKRNVAELGPGAVEYLLRGPIGSEVTLTVQSPGAAARPVTLKRSAR
jgi:hypothetical protein